MLLQRRSGVKRNSKDISLLLDSKFNEKTVDHIDLNPNLSSNIQYLRRLGTLQYVCQTAVHERLKKIQIKYCNFAFANATSFFWCSVY